MGDVDEIVQELMKIPDWEELEVAEYRIKRRFIELVSQLD